MNVTKNGITISIADDEVIRLALERFRELDKTMITPGDIKSMQPAVVPKIGETWVGQGGIYAGLARGRDGNADYHLIVGPEYDGTTNWDAAVKWAASTTAEEFSDFQLPFRKEQALCFANVPELFKQEAYWSGEQRASSSSFAWCQHFGDGYQSDASKGSTIRARAVRRLIIQ